MTATAYPPTMTDLRGEPGHSNFWSSYNSSAHLSNRISSAAMDSSFHSSASSSPLSGKPRSGPEQNYPYGRYSQEESPPYDRHSHHSSSYPSLKRPFSQSEPPAYQEMVHDMRDHSSRLSVNQDHKMLSFKRTPDKHTLVDQQGRIQQLDLSAQLHGMFFLSEMPSTASDGTALQPELTCYRRNLFQISGSLITPRGQIFVVNDNNDSVPVSGMEVAISAIESVDKNPVRLIVIPWKTPPPNSPEISQSGDQEPPSLPLIPFQEDGSEPEGDYAVYPIGWRRLQFRIATANNGRRKELQQHFVLHLKVHGTLANNSKVVLTESITAPIVVRGRSPRNFQARKEIPLLGSSAGSRGQALMETGLGVVAGALSVKPHEPKRGGDIQVPRSSFTFSPLKTPGGPPRSSTYPAWSPGGNSQLPQVTSSSPGAYPATATATADPYPKVSISSASSFATEPQELPNEQQSSGRGQYTYAQPTSGPASTPALSGQDMSIPRYVDHCRPTKSSRHSDQQSVHSTSSASNSESPEYRYGSSAPPSSAPSRDYYPPVNTWATPMTPPATAGAENSDARSYPFPHEAYKAGTAAAAAAAPAAAPTKSEPRGPYESMSSYSWSTN